MGAFALAVDFEKFQRSFQEEIFWRMADDHVGTYMLRRHFQTGPICEIRKFAWPETNMSFRHY